MHEAWGACTFTRVVVRCTGTVRMWEEGHDDKRAGRLAWSPQSPMWLQLTATSSHPVAPCNAERIRLQQPVIPIHLEAPCRAGDGSSISGHAVPNRPGRNYPGLEISAAGKHRIGRAQDRHRIGKAQDLPDSSPGWQQAQGGKITPPGKSPFLPHNHYSGWQAQDRPSSSSRQRRIGIQVQGLQIWTRVQGLRN